MSIEIKHLVCRQVTKEKKKELGRRILKKKIIRSKIVKQ